jgi:sec-independent protein translocase protein TatA
MMGNNYLFGLFGGLGGWEVVLILVLVLLLFGAKRLPEIARSLGKSLREFKKATKEVKDELDISDEIEEGEYKQEKKGDKLPPKNSPDKDTSKQ